MSIETWLLVVGALIVLAAGFVGGVTGFGFNLLCTPALLLLGLPLGTVVTLNLALSLGQRVSTLVRLRRHVWLPRAAMLVTGSVPGTLLGLWLLTWVDVPTLKRAAGAVVMLAVAWQVWQARGPQRTDAAPIPGVPFVAGLLGGTLGVTTSLNGPPAAILLARERAAPRTFQADIAFYFVVGNAVALALLAARGALAREAFVPLALLWLPTTLLGNYLGVTFGTRLNDEAFRRAAYIVAFLSGLVTAVTA